ncbi:LacI family DNA-binding transcriptional regulator [Streptomyces sp. NPDC002738]
MAARSKPTLKDVATACGVSIGTVSYALNGKGRLDDATRARIREAADRLGYTPNRVARGLRSGRSSTLGLLMPAPVSLPSQEVFSTDWYAQVAMAAAEAAFHADHALLLLPAVHDAAELSRVPVDGVIVADPHRDDPRLVVLDQLGVPTVSLGHDAAGLMRHYVAPDTKSIIRQLLDHIAEQGARRILLLTPEAGWEWARVSISTYRHWCTSKGRPSMVVTARMPDASSAAAFEEAAYREMRRVLAEDDRPDAVVALCLGFGLGVLRAARELGIRVPEDLLVAQDVDEPALHSSDPPVTAVDLFPRRQATAAVQMLVSDLAGDPAQSAITIPVALRARASTRASTTPEN